MLTKLIVVNKKIDSYKLVLGGANKSRCEVDKLITWLGTCTCINFGE